MNLIIFSILVVLTCLDNVSGATVNVQSRVVMKKYTGNSKLPVVPNAEKCGGYRSFSEIRYQSCKISDGSCTVPASRDLQVEIDYKPAKDAKKLNFQIEVEVDDKHPETIFRAPILNSGVKKGKKYTIEIHKVISSIVKGQQVKFKYQLTGEERSHKFCMEAETWVD